MRTKFVLYSMLVVVCIFLVAGAGIALASHTPNPSSVTIAGDLQSELGCSGDWQADCATTHLAYDANDDAWQGTFNVPAGEWQYKAALNNGWDENYGKNATPNGENIVLNLASPTAVKFYYDHKSHWVTSNKNSVIATVPGSFQSELGCSGDWDPECLRSWLEDPDGDGTYSFSTTSIPVGNYDAKVAISESWNENYGLGGVPGGANIPFTIPANGSTATFSYNPSTHLLTISVVSPGPQPDNNVEWDGLRHDSRDLLYRTPGGAVPAGTPVKLRFRTYHNDVTSVKLRLYDLNTSKQEIKPMQLAASDVSCYQDGLPYTCDFWEVTLPNSTPDNLWYRFIITDGTKTVYYADDTPALDGGLGSTSDNVVDNSYALMVYQPGFSAPAWASQAVIYQVFPDRFRNGRDSNNPLTGDVRYDDPALALPWGTLPEGYCRNYADSATNCPWRFDTTPPDWSPTVEGPRGRDYMGGDLRGVDQYLDYLKSLGITTIYFNPIFDGGSNHGYDTQDYYKVDPYFGTQKDWENLVKHAGQRGMKIILDGVFNHMSSDSPIFDRYSHYATVGACESVTSTYRPWFYFHDVPLGQGPCAGSDSSHSATYDGWFGFDTIPVINKSLPAVQDYFLTGSDSVSKHWLKQGASGWRLDVSGDASFPDGYWETFRQATKATDPNALLISETWQKDSTLLRILRGDRLDTTMNYRLRDAVVGLMAPQIFDSKGFADSGYVIKPSQFAARLASMREDYPDAAYYSLMNLLDSHDTERILWTLTPGTDTQADKELNAANLAEGKQRQKVASLIQFTMPGAPTVYYGDEVALSGDDDPDNRRTYPWADLGGSPDTAMFSHYQALTALRKNYPVLVSGNFQVLLADDAAGVVAYGRKTTSQAAVVIVNRSKSGQGESIPVGSFLPDGMTLQAGFVVGSGSPGTLTASGGELNVTLGPLSAVLFVTGKVDLEPTSAPAGLVVSTEGNDQVGLVWNNVAGAATYNLYRSPLSGGGWVKVNTSPLSGTNYNDTGLRNGQVYYYVVTALDNAGNESSYSNEVQALPHLQIGWANLQWPPTLTHTISVVNRTRDIYGQVRIDGQINQPGPTPTLRAQLGFGPEGSNPKNNSNWTWVEASFNTDAGDFDEFKASLLPESVGTFDYVYRYSTTNGRDWLYADLSGPVIGGDLPANPGKLTVSSSSDITPPAAPANFHLVSSSPVSIDLAWDAVAGDATLYGYEILRSDTAGGPYTMLARLTDTQYSDTAVNEGDTYFYVVRAVDQSFNRSGYSNEVQAKAVPRTVSVTFNVTVPATTDGTGLKVYIAGSLDRLDGNLPQWDPGDVVLTRVDSTHWSITLTGAEGTQIEYKYTLGSWDYVEKGAACDEIANRQLTLSYGVNGTQTVNDTVLNWRNVSPCGS